MSQDTQTVVYVGIGGHVVAVDLASGQEIWRRKVKTSQLTTVTLVEDRLLVTAGGELFCLDRSTGEVRWHNRLKRLGAGLVTLASADLSPALAAALAAQQAAAASAATAAG